MACLLSICILLLTYLLISVAAINDDLDVAENSCAAGDSDSEESCNKDALQNKIEDLDPLEASKKYGVEQTADGQETLHTLQKIRESLQYMRKLENTNVCRNEHELCAFWAVIGECRNNQKYMREHCGPSCQSCTENISDTDGNVVNSSKDKPTSEMTVFELSDAVKEYGEPQKAEGDDILDTLDVIRKSIDYMRNLGDSLKQEIKNKCKNKHELCAFWAAIGECEVNVSYMKENCSPSCRSCEIIDSFT